MSEVHKFKKGKIFNGVNSSYIIKMPSQLGEVNKAVDNILKLPQFLKIDKSITFDIKLCLEEALINAVRHGSKNNKNLPITIDYSISDEMFNVSIQDCGRGFDYSRLPDPTAKENLLRTKGRGIYLIRHLMDEVTFNKNGNKITMIKYLRGEHENK